MTAVRHDGLRSANRIKPPSDRPNTHSSRRGGNFFLEGVAETANQAFGASQRIVALFKEDREALAADGPRAGSVLRVHDCFKQMPYLTAKQLVERTGLTTPTVNAVLAQLQSADVIDEITERKRGRVYSYPRYLAILIEGTEPLSAR